MRSDFNAETPRTQRRLFATEDTEVTEKNRQPPGASGAPH